MMKEILPLELTGQFPRLILDYLSGREDMKPFYDYAPDIHGLKDRLEELKKKNFDRAGLVHELTLQHADTPLSEKQASGLEALKSGRGFTLCTGHQLCLMSGPAYVVYKICSIISLARALEAEWGTEDRVVPIFWLASEDHDIDEIDHFSLFNKTIGLETEFKGAAGKMPLTGMEAVLEELSQVLGDSKEALLWMQMATEAYAPAHDLAKATRSLINALFAQEGLLILDGDSSNLKRPFIPLIEKELKESFVESAIAPSLSMLEHRGEKIQATPREINLFYLVEGLRTRIVRTKGEFNTVEGGYSWSENDLLAELKLHPERFSPNVLMRPLYQELLLPNLAYMGGPGELSYWLELKGMFHAAGMFMPVVLLRDSFMPLDKRSEEKWNSLGFEVKDFFRPEDDLHKSYAMKNGAEEVDLIKEKESLIHHFDKLIEKSLLIDPSLAQFAKGEKARLENAVDTLEKKMIRAEKKKHSDALGRISQLKEKFLPGGALLERKESIIPLWMKWSDGLIPALIDQADPLSPGLKVLRVD